MRVRIEGKNKWKNKKTQKREREKGKNAQKLMRESREGFQKKK